MRKRFCSLSAIRVPWESHYLYLAIARARREQMWARVKRGKITLFYFLHIVIYCLGELRQLPGTTWKHNFFEYKLSCFFFVGAIVIFNHLQYLSLFEVIRSAFNRRWLSHFYPWNALGEDSFSPLSFLFALSLIFLSLSLSFSFSLFPPLLWLMARTLSLSLFPDDRRVSLYASRIRASDSETRHFNDWAFWKKDKTALMHLFVGTGKNCGGYFGTTHVQLEIDGRGECE